MRSMIVMFLTLGICLTGVCFAQSSSAQQQSTADDTLAFMDFQQKAKIWQALPKKPPLPEEARRFRVLADDAVGNKNFDDAANYYEQGLAIDPMWPAGQFNAAMIYQELERYPMAVMHMKRYLALDPEAKEARTYQDKIYLWEEKAKRSNSIIGTWDMSWSVAGKQGHFGTIIFQRSDSGDIVASMGNTPFLRGTTNDLKEISWEVYLDPAIGCCPSGWQPVISYDLGSNKKTMKVVVPSQWASDNDARKGSLQDPMRYDLIKISGSQN